MSTSNPLRSKLKEMALSNDGTHHFLVQRISALVLIPLVLWLCFSIAALPGNDHASIQAWVGSWTNAALLVLIIATAFFHAKLGTQVILEDYISNIAKRNTAIMLTTIICILLALVGVFSVLKIAFTA